MAHLLKQKATVLNRARRLRQSGLTLMEMLVAISLSVVVIAGVASVTSFVIKRFHAAGSDQAQADGYARINERMVREVAEVVAWHTLGKDRVVYTSSFVAPGEERDPYSSSLACVQAENTRAFSLVYQRLQPWQPSVSMPTAGSQRSTKALMEVNIASDLTSCSIKFGVRQPGVDTPQQTIQWLDQPREGEDAKITHLRVAMTDATGARFPLFIAKR